MVASLKNIKLYLFLYLLLLKKKNHRLANTVCRCDEDGGVSVDEGGPTAPPLVLQVGDGTVPGEHVFLCQLAA